MLTVETVDKVERRDLTKNIGREQYLPGGLGRPSASSFKVTMNNDCLHTVGPSSSV
jgi:hypothetical protein